MSAAGQRCRTCRASTRSPFLTNTTVLALDRVPRHLVVVGGSYIGLEFAQMYRRFGAAVTVVEMGPRLIAREDEDVSRRDPRDPRRRGHCRAHRRRVHQPGAACGGRVRSGSSAPRAIPRWSAPTCCWRSGRRPNTDDLGLDKAGVATDARGYIQVDEGLATNVPGIWALGDCNGRGAFTHTAYNDFEIVAANLLDGESRRVSDRIPGYALYIDPPLGRVGMTETQARSSGRKLLTANRPMSRVGRAIEKGETQGFMKVAVDAETQADPRRRDPRHRR